MTDSPGFSLTAFLRSRSLASWLKGSALFLSVVGIIVFVRLFDLESVMSREWVNEHLRSRGIWGVLLFAGLVSVLAPAGVPRQALSALGGYTFGALMGTVWTSLALVAGCSLGFFYARFLGKDMVQRRFGKHTARLERFLAHNPFAMSMAIRLFPFGNNALTTMAAGVSRIPAAPFIAGSGIGYLPQTVIFALLGSGIRVEPMFRTLAAALLFALSSLLGYYLYSKYKKETPASDDSAYPAVRQEAGKPSGPRD